MDDIIPVALKVLGATAAVAGLSYGLGRQKRERPRGPAILYEDIAKAAKFTCKTCHGKGCYATGGGFGLCSCARERFQKKHGHEVVEWRGEVYWREPRA